MSKKQHKRKPGAVWYSQFTYCGLITGDKKEMGLNWKKVTCKNCLKKLKAL